MSRIQLVQPFPGIFAGSAALDDFYGASKCTWVAVKRNGEWRAIAEHITRIPPVTPVAAQPPAQK